MPGTTATQGLIYPVGTDRACDGATQLEVLAKGISGRFTVLDGLVDTAEDSQMVLVQWTGPDDGSPLDDVTTNSGVIWNQVIVDDADAFDTGVSAISIKLPYVAPGQLWEIGCYVKGEWTGGSPLHIDGAQVNLGIYDASGLLVHFANEDRFLESDDGVSGGSIVTLLETSGAMSIKAEWSFTTFEGSIDEVLTLAQLWAIRVAEA